MLTKRDLLRSVALAAITAAAPFRRGFFFGNPTSGGKTLGPSAD
jgi:hypothetical protein